jgi:hypothetical protein
MNSLEFQKKLDNAWKELIVKRKKDKKFEGEQAGIKAHDKYWFTLNQNNLPGIIIYLKEGHNLNFATLPKAKGWNFINSNTKITMNVNEEKYKDFFIKLINLILTKIFLENLTREKSVKCFLENLISAKDFFEDDNVPRKLAKESQIGLYGEVYVLSKILIKKLTNEIAISSWTGPSKKHDFTTENKLVETKTTVTSSKKVNTSSTNQIAPVFDKKLDLIFLQMKKSNTGLSLGEIIDEYINKLRNESEILHNDFLLKLTQCNYLDIHKDEYIEKYSIDKASYYKISEEFPYIKKVEIPNGISELAITYKIDLEKCENFRISEDDFLNNL